MYKPRYVGPRRGKWIWEQVRKESIPGIQKPGEELSDVEQTKDDGFIGEWNWERVKKSVKHRYCVSKEVRKQTLMNEFGKQKSAESIDRLIVNSQ